MADNNIVSAKMLNHAKPKNLNIYDLNDDCLIYIFEQLDIRDWLKLSMVSKRFRERVVQDIVPRKLVDFTVVRKKHVTREIFQLFGKSMKKLKISSQCVLQRHSHKAFEKFLRLLLKYSKPGLLKEVQLEFRIPKKTIDIELIIQSVPYFVNVTILKLRAPRDSEHSLEQWLGAIIHNRIHSLDLNGINPFTSKFILNPFELKNLEHLKLHFIPRHNVQSLKNNLIDFIKAKPNLKSFSIDTIEDHQFFETISEYSSQVGCIGQIPVENMSKQNIKTFLKSLKQFDNLKQISFHGYLDSHDIFHKIFKFLMPISTLKMITIEIEPAAKTFDFDIDFGSRSYEEKAKQIDCLHFISYDLDMCADDYYYVFTNVFDFKKCILSGDMGILHPDTIITIIKHRFRLEILIIDAPTWLSKKLYKNLLYERKLVMSKMEVPKSLTIYLEPGIANKFKAGLEKLYDPQIISIAPKSNVYYECFM